MKRDDDAGVATVIGALLILSALVSFLVVYQLEWAPVFVENREGDASAELQSALVDWGATAEGFVNSGFANRTFSRSLPVGVSTGLLLGSRSSTGGASVEPEPTLKISRNGTQISSVSGGLRVDADYEEFPNQTLRYTFGALEITQASGTWVDLRGLVVAQRGAGGVIDLATLVLGLQSAPQSRTGGASVDVVGHVESASASENAAGTVRFLVENVRADSWRAAFNRTFSAAVLDGETAADCSSSARDWCFDSSTNTPSTADVYVRNVGSGWPAVTGLVRVELRA